MDKVGCRFGFVRFGSHVNRVVVQKELNDIWFGSYKLRANVARFNSSREGKDRSTQRKETTYPSYIPPCGYGDRSFVEVVSGGIRDSRPSKSISPQYNQNIGGMRFESSEEDRRYLKQSFIGFLKEDFLWIDIGSKIQEKSEGLVAVKYLGGSLVLIHPIKPERIIIEDLECFTTWFDSFKQWSDDIVDHNRIIWTNWFGVPMHAWNTKFFNQLSCQFGQLIRVDEDTRCKRKLQMARILIRTPYHELPRTPIAVTIDGKMFHIRVREEEEDLEEDSEDWSSVDVTDDDGESDYVENQKMEQVDQAPKGFSGLNNMAHHEVGDHIGIENGGNGGQGMHRKESNTALALVEGCNHERREQGTPCGDAQISKTVVEDIENSNPNLENFLLSNKLPVQGNNVHGPCSSSTESHPDFIIQKLNTPTDFAPGFEPKSSRPSSGLEKEDHNYFSQTQECSGGSISLEFPPGFGPDHFDKTDEMGDEVASDSENSRFGNTESFEKPLGANQLSSKAKQILLEPNMKGRCKQSIKKGATTGKRGRKKTESRAFHSFVRGMVSPIKN